MADNRVDIVLADGTLADVPESDLQAAIGAGAQLDTGAQRERRDQLDLARSAGGQAVSAIMGADEAILGLGSTAGFAALEAIEGKGTADETRAAIREMRDQNPLSGLAGNAAAGIALGGVSEAVGVGGGTAAARIGRAALGQGLEGAMQGFGSAMVEKNLGNPEANAEGYFADKMAEGFLMGGAFGAGFGALGEVGKRSLNGLGRTIMGGERRASQEFMHAAEATEKAMDGVMATGKFTSAEAQEALASVSELARKSVVDKGADALFEEVVSKVAKNDPELVNVLRTVYTDGARLASKGDEVIEGLTRRAAKDGDALIATEDKLYDISISGKNAKMAELVDPNRGIEAMDAAVAQVRQVEEFIQRIDAMPNKANAGIFVSNLKKQVDTFQQAISGSAREVSAVEAKLAARAEKLETRLSEATERVSQAEARVAAGSERAALGTAEEALEGAPRRRMVDQTRAGAQQREMQAAAKKELEHAQLARDLAAERLASVQPELDAARAASKPARAPKAVSPSQIFMELDNLKRNAGKLQRQIGMSAEGGLKDEFLRVYQGMQETLENGAIWGEKAAMAQREVNGAWTQRLSTRRDLSKEMMRDFGNKEFETLERMDPAKLKGYLKNISGPENDLKREALSNWLDGTENAMAVTEKHYGGPAADYAAGREAIANFRKVLGEAETQATTIESISKLRAREGDGIGGALGIVTDVFTRPVKTAERLAAVRDAANRTDTAIRKAVGSLFDTNIDSFAAGMRKSADSAAAKKIRDSVAETTKTVRDYIANPAVLQDKIGKAIQGMGDAAPEHAAAIAAVASRAAIYLAQHAPVSIQNNDLLRGRSSEKYSDWQKDEWVQRVRTVEDPMSAVRDAARGRISQIQVDVLKNVYPMIYQKIQGAAMDELQKVHGTKDAFPYAKRLQIGTLLSIPADSTMNPSFIETMQLSTGMDPEKGSPQAEATSQAPSPAGGINPQKAPRKVKIDRDSWGTSAQHIEQGGSQR